MRLSCLLLLLTAVTASAQPAPGVLAHGLFNATITAEVDASKGTFGDPTSIAPDISIAAGDRLTFLLIHSTFGRTGFRGGAGAGICITDRCAKTYDNVGGEVYLGLYDGTFAFAANGGIHANSFDGELYAGKLGARMRLRAGPLSLVSVPSVAIAITKRDDSPDRIFVPFNVSALVGGGVSLGLITGFKSPLDDIEASYEIAAGAFVTYQATPSLGFAASWVHGKIIGGDTAVPEGTSGIDSRALQIWVTITRSAYTRYR
ncbi:MAG: hypothetical protein M4D80_37720 [Myxococcota bacterium]|nr:hypothetical protein [Myxococcota bacterium]